MISPSLSRRFVKVSIIVSLWFAVATGCSANPRSHKTVANPGKAIWPPILIRSSAPKAFHGDVVIDGRKRHFDGWRIHLKLKAQDWRRIRNRPVKVDAATQLSKPTESDPWEFWGTSGPAHVAARSGMKNFAETLTLRPGSNEMDVLFAGPVKSDTVLVGLYVGNSSLHGRVSNNLRLKIVR
jgi:hypothetical protein